ncbi:Uncharacterised protein [Mycobacteroides abscessus subsp. abscessus]|uniref:HEPN domain-containing protein n=1 Tax=Mycobacteroides abscessus TaxID=36809 RepID=UPI0009272757|nr:HEPN domain-containing protein [Mycobacteroides abscessus]SHT67798.1 Uncharacterised protein [Mycobacteroides abscessus subsp. abscessus]SHW84863.1 Uncharacterised protein [Mycobacteroides abscessus subsp. abscessus]SIG30133.1 Uncharacterised protein [Mycobacteroides abscessus subsp. abscessus]SKD18207.1 Uncharacterised protein [Mycobacteroides abscessus subsp. abscessus]SKL98667.1 Uncharacterised protein [Mycobacteroides abscessus subsp. abscessus]
MGLSKARIAFKKNRADILKLAEAHSKITPKTDGEVMLKSAVVLLTAFWEAYCEDLAAEALQHMVVNLKDPQLLPETLKREIANEFKQKNQHELAAWKLAGDGWRNFLLSRLEDLQAKRNWDMNTPNTENIDRLFSKALGIEKISDKWAWEGTDAEAAAKKLNGYVRLRGLIAHRGAPPETITSNVVNEYNNLVNNLMGKTGGHVHYVVKKATGTGLW